MAELAPVGAAAGDPQYTIDQLAQETGVTTRNIRAHQSRGLLPPPAVRGRTGFYGPEHIARLRFILRMQADGFNLNAIRRILDSVPAGSVGEVLDFESALRSAWEEEQPEIFERDELLRLLGLERMDAAVEARAQRLGLVTPLPDGRLEVRSPALVRAAADLVSLGIPLNTCLDVQEGLTRHAQGVARSFNELFLAQIWQPFERAGRPEAEWPRIQQALERMRPLATEALLATFRLAMGREVERAFGRILEQQARAGRRGPRGGARP